MTRFASAPASMPTPGRSPSSERPSLSLLGASLDHKWLETSFLSEESHWMFIVSLYCSLVSVQTTSVQWIFCAGLLNPALLGARHSRASGRAVLLACVVVLKFVLSLWMPVKYWRVRSVYFYGFEPREGDEPTRSRLKSKNQHFRALCFSLISSAWSPGNLAWAEWIPGTDKSPALKVQIAHGCLGSQGIIKPWEPSKNQGLVVTLVLSRHLSMSCYKIPSQYWDLISKVRKTVINLKLTKKNLFRIEIISWKTWLLEVQGCQRMKLVNEKKV